MVPKRPRIAPKPKCVKSDNEKDPVQVFCRIRPLDVDDDEFIEKSDTYTVKLVPPVNSFAARNGNAKEQTYRFEHVFDSITIQKELFDHVAKPLVSDLLTGKNGLLFMYGITGSGKTYTMEGTKTDGGLLPRTIDVVFNTIGSYQTRKYIFKADRMNGFDAQSEADAFSERQRNVNKPFTRSQYWLRRDENSSRNSSRVLSDSSQISCFDEDNVFAVFVNYIEIYNNYVYDLLEEFSETNMVRDLQSKILREDAAHNMYAHGCTEVEVKTREEAFEVLHKGHKRRKVAHTRLNCESSRSHSIFTIRIVQAPLDEKGEEVITDKSAITVSQLCLVDLAGSERTARAATKADRLKESGSINNSLMTLRQCIEILRENQQTGMNRVVPYRQSKLTHYFKNYFEGKGKVKMIMCINPRAVDYDETLSVMKFAELASEVQVQRPLTVKRDLGLMPGRRRANMAFKEVRRRLQEDEGVAKDLPIDISPIYFISPDWPSLDLNDDKYEEVLDELHQFLTKRIEDREKMERELQEQSATFRQSLIELESEAVMLRQQNASLMSLYSECEKESREKEVLLRKMEDDCEGLKIKFENYNAIIDQYKQAFDEKDTAISQGHIDQQRLKSRLKLRLEKERDRLARDVEHKLKTRQMQLKKELYKQQKRVLEEVLGREELYGVPIESGIGKKVPAQKSDPDLRSKNKENQEVCIGAAVSNHRHRRSVSLGGNVQWVDHKANAGVELDTVLQPNMQRKRSVRKLKSGDLLDKRATHYCLTTQSQDKTGLQTRMYKGDILPTSGGGAQVVFNDVEELQQKDPLDASIKRCSDGTPKVNTQLLQDRCSQAIAGTPRITTPYKMYGNTFNPTKRFRI